MSRQILKEYIKLLIELDAPENSLFGSYLFGPLRKDVKTEEPNTRLENEFQAHLLGHYEGNDISTAALEKLMPELFDLKSKGHYKDFLLPPTKPSYRMLKLDESYARKLGLKEFDGISAQTAGPGTLKPVKGKIQSWTMKFDLDFALNIAGTWQGYKIRPGQAVAVFKVNNPKDNFILNPYKMASKIDFGGMSDIIKTEKEVLSFGPVKYDQVAVFVNPTADFGRVHLIDIEEYFPALKKALKN